ncbi:hypothetical protein [Candidatus Chlorohelix sp.]
MLRQDAPSMGGANRLAEQPRTGAIVRRAYSNTPLREGVTLQF